MTGSGANEGLIIDGVFSAKQGLLLGEHISLRTMSILLLGLSSPPSRQFAVKIMGTALTFARSHQFKGISCGDFDSTTTSKTPLRSSACTASDFGSAVETWVVAMMIE